MELLEQLQELAEKISKTTDIQLVKDYSLLLVQLSNDRQGHEKDAITKKLEYDREYRELFDEKLEELKAVNKTEKAVELELADKKEAYKLAEGEAGRYKALYNAHQNNMWIAKLDIELGKTAEISSNSDSELPF